MITVHNLNKSGVATPLTSSIVYDNPIEASEKIAPGGSDGWQAFSGKSTITWTSPEATSETETASSGHLAGAVMDNVNRARYVEIAVGTGADDLSKLVAKSGETHLLSASEFGNWRKKSHNGFSDISKRVYLNLKNAPVTDYQISYKSGDLASIIKDNPAAKMVTKVSDAVNNVAATFGAIMGNDELSKAAIVGERMSRFNKFPTLKVADTTTTGGLGSLEFEFKFGQAGIFSGEEEVVKPILALVNTFALQADKGHSVVGPFPTETTAKRKAMTSIIEIIKSGGSGLDFKMKPDEDSGVATSIVNSFNNLTDKIYAVADYLGEALLSLTTTLTVIVGGLVMGPFVVTDIKWKFDFDNVDEYGFPCTGTVSLGGLSPVRIMVGSDYMRQWGYKVGETNDVTPILKKQLVENSQEKTAFVAQATDGQQAEEF